MARSPLPLLLLGILPLAGCLSGPNQLWHEFLGDRPATPVVPADNLRPPQAPPPPPPRVAYARGSGEVSLRVEAVGRKILTANPQAGLRPYFLTLGSPQPELFHRGVTELFITEGLVKQCADEAQLAAVLCHELAKMVAEREALAPPQIRNPDRRPPPSVPFGNDGQFDGVSQVRLAEEAKFERQRPPTGQPLPPPNPKVLARDYLKQAGYPAADLDKVEPLLQAARGNFSLEKQIRQPNSGDWTAGK